MLLTRRDDTAAAVIDDDGRGFIPQRANSGFGLVGMRERMELLDGSLTIESTPDGGTTLVAEVPLR